MATISVNRKEFNKNVKLSGDLGEKLMLAGLSFDKLNDEEIIFEITANRPDLLSAQGIFRHLNSYYNKSLTPTYKVNLPEKNFKVKVDSSLKSIRPFTACAIVKDIKLNDEKIKQLIDLQEKLHVTLGRNRKKLAIGIYPLDKISLPIKFEARKPTDIRFQPLDFPREITGIQILSQHPTGRGYAHLLEGQEKFPVFVDAKGKILSMPPIINSQETGKVSLDTKEVFIECSGFDLTILQKVLNIIVVSLADMGGKIYSMEVDYGSKKITTPNLEMDKVRLSLDNVNNLLGLELTEKDIQILLPKMGYSYSRGIVSVPPWRTDILHEVDIIEDVAIAYGYDKLIPEIPSVATIGEQLPREKLRQKIASIFAGLGFLEVSSFNLIKPEEVSELKQSDLLEVEDSKTDYKYLRYDLLTPLLRISSTNSDSPYPQKTFEFGVVFEKDRSGKSETGVIEKNRLAGMLIDEKTNFTEGKQVLDYLFRMLNLEYTIKETENNLFIPGRAGKIILDKEEIGYIGELHPKILKRNKLSLPAVAFEINTDKLMF